MTVSPAIECIDLSKSYGPLLALRNLTLTVASGSSFGLLGENGAGKSTLVRMLMGFIAPTSGQVRVLGEEQVARAHAHVGYVHERPIFEHRFSGRAMLTYLAQLSGLWGRANKERVNTLLAQVHLTEAADRATGTYSKGMLQRLAIAQALLNDPALLILDEPTSGLDPRSQWEIRQLLLGLRREGRTLFLCSHYLAEVETLCDTVGILRQGELILSGTVTDLLRSQGIVEITLAQELEAKAVLARLRCDEEIIEAQGNTVRLHEEAQERVLAALVAAHIPICSLHPVSHTLEEIYVQTTQGAIADEHATSISTHS